MGVNHLSNLIKKDVKVLVTLLLNKVCRVFSLARLLLLHMYIAKIYSITALLTIQLSVGTITASGSFHQSTCTNVMLSHVKDVIM